jgi:glycosyltransferase involved in cell wall biosynthesis
MSTPDRLRVALLARECSPGYAGGGIGTYTTYLAAGLAECGADVTVVGRHDGPWTEERGAYRTVYAPLRAFLGRWPMLADRLGAAVEVRDALRRLGRFDVVEGPDWLAEGVLAPRRSATLRARHVHGGNRTFRVHAARPASAAEHWAERIEAYDLRRADVVTIASRLSVLLPDGRSVLRRPGALVPMPVRLDGWSPTPAGGVPDVVTLVGRVETRKGPDVLLRAASRLRDVTVRFVGPDTPRADGGSSVEALRALAAELRVTAEFTGARGRDAMPDVFAASRVVAVPSRFEPYSVVALEALAAGRPVVLSDACGAAETLDASKGALVFPTEDEAALAAALRRALDDPTELGERGRAHAAAFHSPRVAAQAKLDIWRAALDAT